MPNSYPYDLVGPVTVLWRPANSPGPSDLTHSSRTVWVVCHPSIFEGAFRGLAISSSFAVEASEPVDKTRHKVEIVDLRGKFNIFELMGPKSSQVIKGALTPVPSEERKELNPVSPVPACIPRVLNSTLQFWDGLQLLQCPGGLPSDMVIDLKVYDPRLRSVRHTRLERSLQLSLVSPQPILPFRLQKP